MKKIAFSFFLGLFFFSGLSHAADDHLDFIFEWHCEKEDLNCNAKIPEKEKTLSLENSELSKSFTLDIVIDNPQGEQVNSARAKITYDPEALLVEEILTASGTYSDFSLPEPNAQKIDDQEGTITIGMAGLSSTAKKIYFASLKMKLLKKTATLEYLNVQQNELGDTGIYQSSGLAVVNRLPATPMSLLLSTDGGASSENNNEKLPHSSDLAKPVGLVLRTNDDGTVTLVWPIEKDLPVAGYYLYYGKDASLLIRRKNVGYRNFVEFPGGSLDRGDKYYFQITAYEKDNLESEASDFVSVIVGQPGTESDPFEGDPREKEMETQNKDNTMESDTTKDEKKENASPEKTTDSGPEHILFFLVISAGIAFLGFSLRKIRF
ncbi:hypothetical protein IPN35_04465 [Candidatus Peregrinibacteria bacterium]|nr:MAG: hypothetical protein IPN35_04465 [Candidatus Peregrinibacteria bacterium]